MSAKFFNLTVVLNSILAPIAVVNNILSSYVIIISFPVQMEPIDYHTIMSGIKKCGAEPLALLDVSSIFVWHSFFSLISNNIFIPIIMYSQLKDYSC